MAMIFVDGFSHYIDSNLASKWDVVADSQNNLPGNKLAQDPVGGRFGRGAIVFSTYVFSGISNDTQYVQKNYSGVATAVTGFAFRQVGTQVTNGGRLLTFLDGNTRQVCIDVMPSGQLRAVRSTAAGSGIFDSNHSTTLATSANAISSSSYDYLEFKITHHATLGSITVKRNGTETFWTVTNINTDVAGSGTSSSLLLGSASRDGGSSRVLSGIVSDFYLLNTSGSAPENDFLGDIQVETLRPTADGNYTEWTPNTGTDHFALVDDANNAIDDDATRNSSLTVGNRDTFEFE